MNIYDKSSEAFKNYSPLPDAKKMWKNNAMLITILLIGVFMVLGSVIARPGFFLTYRGLLLLTAFAIALSVFAVQIFIFQSRSLTDIQLYHDFMFVIYSKSPASPTVANVLLTITALNIIMGNAENARFAYELIGGASHLKPKSMAVYEKVKAYMENGDSPSDGNYSLERLTPGLYRRLKRAKPFAVIMVFCDILLISSLVYLTFFI